MKQSRAFLALSAVFVLGCASLPEFTRVVSLEQPVLLYVHAATELQRSNGDLSCAVREARCSVLTPEDERGVVVRLSCLSSSRQARMLKEGASLVMSTAGADYLTVDVEDAAPEFSLIVNEHTSLAPAGAPVEVPPSIHPEHSRMLPRLVLLESTFTVITTSIKTKESRIGGSSHEIVMIDGRIVKPKSCQHQRIMLLARPENTDAIRAFKVGKRTTLHIHNVDKTLATQVMQPTDALMLSLHPELVSVEKSAEGERE